MDKSDARRRSSCPRRTCKPQRHCYSSTTSSDSDCSKNYCAGKNYCSEAPKDFCALSKKCKPSSSESDYCAAKQRKKCQAKKCCKEKAKVEKGCCYHCCPNSRARKKSPCCHCCGKSEINVNQFVYWVPKRTETTECCVHMHECEDDDDYDDDDDYPCCNYDYCTCNEPCCHGCMTPSMMQRQCVCDQQNCCFCGKLKPDYCEDYCCPDLKITRTDVCLKKLIAYTYCHMYKACRSPSRSCQRPHTSICQSRPNNCLCYKKFKVQNDGCRCCEYT